MARLLDHPLWSPASPPQIEALLSPADVVGYGGAAGGGKTDLLLGAALTASRRAIIYRREGPQLEGLEDRSAEIVGDAGRFTRQRRTWKLFGRVVRGTMGRVLRTIDRTLRFGACPRPGDWKKYQGRPFDLIGFDETPNFLEIQVRMLMTWNRTTVPGQRCRVIMAFNPPTDAEGFWIIDYFGPWLDRNHPNPAKPGELRWFVSRDGKDVEVPGPEPVEHEGRVLRPKSRTFIPARVEDNAFLAGTDYEATLDMLPEPLRSAFRHGDFAAMQQDNAFQVIPTEWARSAQARWRPDGGRGLPMDALGLDIARGGRDKTILSPRHGHWFAELRAYPGTATPDGPMVAGLAVGVARDGAPVQLDVVGVGGSVLDHLVGARVHAVGLNGAEKSHARDRSGRLGFANLRAEMWWSLREALDPTSGEMLALPPDRELLADLTAPRWRLTPQGVLIEAKEDLVKRIGRSPDRGDAVVYANRRIAKLGMIPAGPPPDDPSRW